MHTLPTFAPTSRSQPRFVSASTPAAPAQRIAASIFSSSNSRWVYRSRPIAQSLLLKLSMPCFVRAVSACAGMR